VHRHREVHLVDEMSVTAASSSTIRWSMRFCGGRSIEGGHFDPYLSGFKASPPSSSRFCSARS
jgi:hypothetical protein